MRTDGYVQIDVMRLEEKTAICNLFTPQGVVKIVMSKEDYYFLKGAGFFIWDAKMADGKSEVNTSKAYYLKNDSNA
jgi:hypothetical protein